MTLQPITQIRCATHTYGVFASATTREAVEAATTDLTLCIADRTVHRLFPDAFERLESVGALLLVDASETTKSYAAAGEIVEWLLNRGVRKTTHLLVVGGGTVQDVGGFVASILMRGIRWSLVSTTLLGQCDSCIGSKSSINSGTLKNQLGTFWAPTQVFLPEDALTTLSWDDIRSGLGEAIKLHLLAGTAQSTWLTDRLRTIEVGSVQGLHAIVRSSIAIKKPYIEKDEFDKGIRNLLNYGHTFGHAFETVTEHAIPHGIAVTLGMLAATALSVERGCIDRSGGDRLFDALAPWHVPYGQALATVPEAAIVNAMKRDKKATGAALVCILTKGPGAMEIVEIANPDEVVASLGRFKSSLMQTS